MKSWYDTYRFDFKKSPIQLSSVCNIVFHKLRLRALFQLDSDFFFDLLNLTTYNQVQFVFLLCYFRNIFVTNKIDNLIQFFLWSLLHFVTFKKGTCSKFEHIIFIQKGGTGTHCYLTSQNNQSIFKMWPCCVLKFSIKKHLISKYSYFKSNYKLHLVYPNVSSVVEF